LSSSLRLRLRLAELSTTTSRRRSQRADDIHIHRLPMAIDETERRNKSAA
jgi:hypothetical protein